MFSLDFVDALKNIVNRSMINTVSLQSRHVGVFRYPYSNRSPNKYYLFDIFLFNSSDTIKYDVALMEIKAFFDNLKSHRSHTLANGAKIGLKFEFNHRIKRQFYDYYDTYAVSIRKLRPLMGKGWELKVSRPHMVISDVNWCFRTAFNGTNEIEMVDRESYKIKHTDITIYNWQFDSYSFLSEERITNVLYICIDLFSDHIALTKGHPHIKSGTRLDVDDIDDESTVDGRVGVIILSVVVVLLLGIVLYIVHFKFQKKNLQLTLRESHNISDISNIDNVIQQENASACSVQTVH